MENKEFKDFVKEVPDEDMKYQLTVKDLLNKLIQIIETNPNSLHWNVYYNDDREKLIRALTFNVWDENQAIILHGDLF